MLLSERKENRHLSVIVCGLICGWQYGGIVGFLISNLLDNAIHECVKVVRQGRKAVIHVKLVQEGS